MRTQAPRAYRWKQREAFAKMKSSWISQKASTSRIAPPKAQLTRLCVPELASGTMSGSTAGLLSVSLNLIAANLFNLRADCACQISALSGAS